MMLRIAGTQVHNLMFCTSCTSQGVLFGCGFSHLTGSLSALRVLRVLRVARVLRLLRFFRPLWLLVIGATWREWNGCMIL